jgi:hypothetical protein
VLKTFAGVQYLSKREVAKMSQKDSSHDFVKNRKKIGVVETLTLYSQSSSHEIVVSW